jgi:hypothetical protein
MPDPHDEDQQPDLPPPPSALETVVQDHPIAALLAAAALGVVLAKTVF